jgi:hypothetical protein
MRKRPYGLSDIMAQNDHFAFYDRCCWRALYINSPSEFAARVIHQNICNGFTDINCRFVRTFRLTGEEKISMIARCGPRRSFPRGPSYVIERELLYIREHHLQMMIFIAEKALRDLTAMRSTDISLSELSSAVAAMKKLRQRGEEVIGCSQAVGQKRKCCCIQ